MIHLLSSFFSFDDITCLSNSNSLNELSLDGNPFSVDPSYKQVILRHLSSLRQLDMKRISVRVKCIFSLFSVALELWKFWRQFYGCKSIDNGKLQSICLHKTDQIVRSSVLPPLDRYSRTRTTTGTRFDLKFFCVFSKHRHPGKIFFTRRVSTVIFIKGGYALCPSQNDKTSNIW